MWVAKNGQVRKRQLTFTPMTLKYSLATLAGAFVLATTLSAKAPVLLEAENGSLGSELQTETIEGVASLTASTDGAGNNPGSAERVASYSVTFPEAGVYQFYARMYVGSDAASDDSFFYGNGFGEKDATSDDDWITVNQLASGVGSTAPEDFVPGFGAAGSEVWKWVLLSGVGFGEDSIDFTVPEGELTQTFQIGAREDGLYWDKLAFGHNGYFYTVQNLDNGEEGSQSTPNEPFDPEGPPIATGKWKFLGNVHSASQLENFADYWNQVTPENSGKWGSVEGTRDSMNWTGLDAAYDFAKENGFPFRMHIMVWGAQQPGWINDLSPTEQREEIEEWFAAVAERYEDIDYLEVVNEPIHQAPDGGDTGVVSGRANYIDALGGKGESGWDWIITSFELARQYFPDTPLVINEYGIIGNAARVDDYLEIVDLLLERDLLDVIAFQAHAFSTSTTAEVLKANLDTLATRGLPIMITEMDVDGGTSENLNDQVHLSGFQKIFPVFWDHPSVIGVTLWGFRPGMWRSDQGAYLVLNNGAERPAMTWMQDYVAASAYDNFEGYLERKGLSPETHEIDADADGDGIPTGFEYVTGSDPETPDALTQFWKSDAGRLAVEFEFDPAIRDGVLSVQQSTDFENWESVASHNLLTRISDGLEFSQDEEKATIILTDLVDEESENQFYRVYFSL